MQAKQNRYYNRELSWLEFNQRVLNEALDDKVPLLERCRFLGITGANLDEFFMVRVGGLYMLARQGLHDQDMTGMTPDQQLDAISARTHEMARAQYACFTRMLLPGLERAGIRHCSATKMNADQRRFVRALFENEIFPVISPIAFHNQQELLPKIKPLKLYLAARLKPSEGSMKPRFAVLPLGDNVNRLIRLPSSEGVEYLWVEDIVRAFSEKFFPGGTVMEKALFRVTRNADINLEDEFSADLVQEMEGVLQARKESECVRLETEKGISTLLKSFLQRILKVRERETYQTGGPLKIADITGFTDLHSGREFFFPQWLPRPSHDINPNKSLLDVLSRKSLLFYHPYESFDPVLQLIKEASEDENVLAIKQILYRISEQSPIIDCLKEAAGKGKYVTVIVELKARFDEARNIEWARQMEQSGIHVICGIKGLKTHAKATLVVRRESGGIVRYMHFGTGNYNEKTARLYCDISFMTADSAYGRDASQFFNTITGYSATKGMLKLSAAPVNLRDKLIEMITNEIERKNHGQKALIIAKMNSLVDKALIEKFYEASQAGVSVMLNIRGICCLRPGIKGLSENIRVVSTIGRFLEHTRAYFFLHGGEQKCFISSADGMTRNLDRRIELLVPIEDKNCKSKLKFLLDTHFQDVASAYNLTPSGGYVRRPAKSKKAKSSQDTLMAYFKRKDEIARQEKKTAFKPHVLSHGRLKP